MNRPEFPIGQHPDSQAWREFQIQMEKWIADQAEEMGRWIKANVYVGPDPQALNEGMLTAPRKAKKPAWSGVDREYLAEAKRRQREREKAAPKLCMDCGVEPRLPRKSRCCACDDAQQDRQEEAKGKRKALIKQGLNARKRGECLEVR